MSSRVMTEVLLKSKKNQENTNLITKMYNGVADHNGHLIAKNEMSIVVQK